MPNRVRAAAPALTLAAGMVLGWTLATLQLRPAHADRSSPSGEDQVAAGPITIQHDRGNDIQVEQDAIYYLDYRGARLLATVPSQRNTGGTKHVIDGFAERDLAADFKLTPGSDSPRFLMTTGTMGALNGAWAPLYVFESTTKQVAIYRLSPVTIGLSTVPQFEMLELRSYAAQPPAQATRPQ